MKATKTLRQTKWMKISALCLCALASGSLIFQQNLAAKTKITDLPTLAKMAVSADAEQSQAGIAALRAAGPEGVQALLAENEPMMQRALTLTPLERSGHPGWKQLKTALDRVGAQCDNWASRLYWYTDLEKAKAASHTSGKPILSLRLLGSLNEELSCANSRFFRTALYPDTQINKRLREDFILHWQSVRPAPKVTIDFGDGRKIETTITGNSIHYVLAPDGQIVDALPGLYAPRVFESWLERMKAATSGSFGLRADERVKHTEYLRQFHRNRLDQGAAAWRNDLHRADIAIDLPAPRTARELQEASAQTQSNLKNTPRVQSSSLSKTTLLPDTTTVWINNSGNILNSPTARTAAPFTAAKRAAEPSLNRLTVEVPRDRTIFETATDAEAWKKLAALYQDKAKLDEASIAVLRAKTSDASKVDLLVKTFEQSIAEDTVRNEYLMHLKIHEWLAKDAGNVDLEAFNKRVYAELFLTPDSDPWLGLLPAEAYTGLMNGGVVVQ